MNAYVNKFLKHMPFFNFEWLLNLDSGDFEAFVQ